VFLSYHRLNALLADVHKLKRLLQIMNSGEVLTVVKTEGMAHLMQQDMHIRAAEGTHEVLAADPLAPIAASASLEPVSQPERVVVVGVSTAGARAIIAVLVEEAATRLGALRGTARVLIRINGDAAGGALEEAPVPHGPADDVDGDVGVREVVVAVQPLEPLLVLGRVHLGDLRPLRLGYARARLPPHAHIDLAPRRMDLVPPVVPETPEVRVRRHAVVPDLLQRRREVRGRAPARARGGETVPEPGGHWARVRWK
jgi:hypothetical protein